MEGSPRQLQCVRQSSYMWASAVITCSNLPSYLQNMSFTLHLKPTLFSLAITPGEPLGIVLERFNAYRAPDRQITRVFNGSGEELSMDLVPQGNMTVWLAPPPLQHSKVE